jgi:hypothetical protein
MTIFCSMSADFCSPPASSMWKAKSGSGALRKYEMLIYPDLYQTTEEFTQDKLKFLTYE